MRMYSMLTVMAFGLLLCAGCGKREVSLPGDTPVYTVSCDRTLDDCYTGAQTLCNGPYEQVSSSSPEKKTAPGSFGWVASSGEQQDAGSSGGKYSIRIRCK